MGAIADGVLIRRGDDVRMNDAAGRMLGVEAGEKAFGLLNVRTIDGEPVTREEWAGSVAVANGETQRYRYRVTTGAGKEIVIDGTASPTEDGQGFVTLFRDVTAEHEREFLNEQYVRHLFDAIPTAILLVDPSTRVVVSGNRAFCELVDYELENVVGCTPPYPWWADSNSAWNHGDELRYERLYRRADGRLVPVQVNGQTIRDHDGRALSLLAVITDLSERRRHEQQLVQSGKLAAIGELAAGVAHEINNPLFAILGLVEFLMKDAEPGSKTHERLLLDPADGSRDQGDRPLAARLRPRELGRPACRRRWTTSSSDRRPRPAHERAQGHRARRELRLRRGARQRERRIRSSRSSSTCSRTPARRCQTAEDQVERRARGGRRARSPSPTTVPASRRGPASASSSRSSRRSATAAAPASASRSASASPKRTAAASPSTSEPGRGATFTLRLPLNRAEAAA